MERYVVSRHPQTHRFCYVILFAHRDKWTVYIFIYRTNSPRHSSFHAHRCDNRANYICLFSRLKSTFQYVLIKILVQLIIFYINIFTHTHLFH